MYAYTYILFEIVNFYFTLYFLLLLYGLLYIIFICMVVNHMDMYKYAYPYIYSNLEHVYQLLTHMYLHLHKQRLNSYTHSAHVCTYI